MECQYLTFRSCDSTCTCANHIDKHVEARDNGKCIYNTTFSLSIYLFFLYILFSFFIMSPIIDFVRRQLATSEEDSQQVPVKDETDIISRSGYLNEGKQKKKSIYYYCILIIIKSGTAMSISKRQQLGLNGLLPARVETLEIQKKRALHVLRSKHNLLERYILMAQLRTSNVRLFYKIVMDELEVINTYLHSVKMYIYLFLHTRLGTCTGHLYSDSRYCLS